MNGHRDELWSAYLDGELSASEASEFDRSLTPEERERLGAELRVEHALRDALARGGECPDALWARLKLDMRNVDRPSKRHGRRALRWMAAAGTVAALLAITFGLLQFAGHRISEATFLHVAEASVLELAESADMRTSDPEDAQQYLRDHGFDLELPSMADLGDGQHDTELIGVRETAFRGEKAAELLFNCCEQPLKVVLARQGSAAANAMKAAADRPAAETEVQAVAMVGDYVAAVVGRHRSPQLVEFLLQRVAEELA